MKKYFTLTFALLCMIFISNGVLGQNNFSTVDQITVKSKILNEEREVLISIPHDYKQNQKNYPTIYVLDADVNFHLTNEIISYLSYYNVIEEAIVVGIINLNQNSRSRDFTYTKSTTYPEDYPTAGGGSKFKKFIDDELIPFVDSNYRTKSERTLLGHSLGGLFVLNTIVNNDKNFFGYIAISPTIWWNNQELFEKTKSFLSSKTSLDKYIFISRANESEKNISDAKSLIQIYKSFNLLGCKSDLQLYPNENHASTLIVSTSNALRSMLKFMKK